MSKLKSLKDFRDLGLGLEQNELASLKGGDEQLPMDDSLVLFAETVHYQATTKSDGKADKNRCRRQDNPRLQYAGNTGFHCLEMAG
jgi:hypothetical protein